MRSLLIFRQNSVGKIVGRIFGFAYNGDKVAYNGVLVGAGAAGGQRQAVGEKKVAFFLTKCCVV